MSYSSILPAGSLSPHDRQLYRSMDGGYEKAPVNHVAGFDLAWLRWPAGSVMPLRGYAGPSFLRVAKGALREFMFVPYPGGYKFRVMSLAEGRTRELPSGAFHFIEAVEETLTLHASTPSVAVVDELLPRLRDALDWYVGWRDGPFPPRLLAMLNGAR
jgi:hypothetical protein